jgi:signal transduction histidine kinase
MHVFATTEFAAALLEGTVTFGLALLFLFLNRRYRRPHFLWWGIAFLLYAVRLVAIITFLGSDNWSWLYWHQVVTGWTALALLWAALVFAYQVRWRPVYLAALAFPVIWSWIAIFRLSNFMLAALPAVLFLSGTTLWTGVVFWRYRRHTGSAAATGLAITFLLWGLHHLDYPILRARGAWNPWGYYLDLAFILAIGAGVLLLVIEELRTGASTMAAFSADLRSRDREDFLAALLNRVLALRGVRGAALIADHGGWLETVRAVGDASAWTAAIPASVQDRVATVTRTGQPSMGGTESFVAVLPVHRGSHPVTLVTTGEVAAPFTALDDRILLAIGEQIGAALDTIDLTARLEARTADLERLSARMLQQHEEQRSRLARELHDETAQVFAALKLQLGSLRESVPADLHPRLERLTGLVGAGVDSIRRVSEDLRPTVLDDLGLLPALQALATQFSQWSAIPVTFRAPESLGGLSNDAELAIFRAAQEALSNVARHAGAKRATLEITRSNGVVTMVIEDDGAGMPPERMNGISALPGRSGLFGMRERLTALGGGLRLEAADNQGLRVVVHVATGDKA